MRIDQYKNYAYNYYDLYIICFIHFNIHKKQKEKKENNNIPT